MSTSPIQPHQPFRFRFLDLPTPLRLQIYACILGNKTLHYSSDDCSYYHSKTLSTRGRLMLCRNPNAEAERFDTGITFLPASSKGVGEEEHHSSLHAPCYATTDPATTSLQLQLLLICRTIYLEASLLPFSHNTFAFHGWSGILPFLPLLLPWQKAAVKEVLLYHAECQERRRRLVEQAEMPPFLRPGYGQRWAACEPYVPTVSVPVGLTWLGELKGLRGLRVHVEVLSVGAVRLWGERHRVWRLGGLVEGMEGLGVERVDVAIVVAAFEELWGDGGRGLGPSREQLEAWRQRIRRSRLPVDPSAE